ncbi:protein kinase [Gordonia amicalis]|uniref:protein kinase domain-containing protein n=1 Tax=Gordonia amicalis TaxID=89053 RepID=UPI0022A8043B|nr:protein kinase [Gordonia amicalis]MCZ0913504.1 protein kinase [Gordonia amicalis]
MQIVEPGATFAGYRVISLLGRGGMGQVWLVEHPTLGRREALKIISPNPSDPSFHERFRNEARTAAALDHPGIVTVYTHGVENGSPWFSMTYLDGKDLTGAGPMPVDDVVTIAGRVADALDHAHGQRVIHRDIKPANIVVARGPDGRISRVTVLDFGIARLVDGNKMTATNLFVGTLAYAAPELLTGEAAIPASDQYALACTTFQLLTGSQPFPGTTPMALISGHVNSPAPRPSDHDPALAHLDAVFARALAKRPGDRYASCAEFATALEQAAATGPRRAAPTTPAPAFPPRAQPPAQRYPQTRQPPRTHPLGYNPHTPAPAFAGGFTPPPGGPPRPQKRTGLFVGVGVGAFVLVVALVVTAIALLGSDDAPASTASGASTAASSSTGGSSSTTPGSGGDFESIASSGDSTCAVRGGELFCWGGNQYGTLGDGSTTDRSRPAKVSGVDDVSAVSMGGLGKTCAIAAGDLYCWGHGAGQSGRPVTLPTKVSGLGDVSAVSVGLTTCAISSGDLYCWGNNLNGQTGAGTGASVPVPTRVAGLSDVTAVSSAHTTTCAIAAGSAYCWGNNADGQVGDGTTTNRAVPTKLDLDSPTSISTSLYSTCAVADGSGGASGTVFCWGENESGQLGDGTEVNRLQPTPIDVRGVTQVSTAGYGSCAAAGGSVYCWGSRSALPDHAPDRVNGLSGVTAITTGSANVCAVAGSGMYCWGLNGKGQLGNGTTTTSNEPQAVRFPA